MSTIPSDIYRRIGVLAAAAWLAAGPAAADPGSPAEKNAAPHLLRWMLSSKKDRILVNMPVVDADPNTGFTFGYMPVLVRKTPGTDNIRHIHALNVNYNKNFGVTGEYEYFGFPSSKENVWFDASLSQYWNRNAILEYNSDRLAGRDVNFSGHLEYSRDGSKRFFGFGANTPKSGESNYTLDTLNYSLSAGIPLWKESPLRFNLRNKFEANSIGGSFPPIPDTLQLYPSVTQGLETRHKNMSFRGFLSYDTRDSAITTSRGTYAEAFFSGAEKNAISAYSYHRYGGEVREFLPTGDDGVDARYITALRGRFEDLRGDVPFWLLPDLGGKYTLRSYGQGRFTDHSLLLFGAEERCRVWAKKISGVTASFWVDPFVGLGTVAPRPDLLDFDAFHPAVGVALRAVARPQIVGSADFGVGQEGLKVFLDINYSF